MKFLLKLEELAMAILALYFLIQLDAAWWWFPLFFLGPDISMLGYLAGNKVGAASYNLFHHKAVGISILLIGLLLPDLILQMTGIVLFGHSSLDRIFGYGLKTGEGFQYTHLGMVGKKKN